MMFIFLIHPRDELLDRHFQCTRHRFHAEWDSQRREVGAHMHVTSFIHPSTPLCHEHRPVCVSPVFICMGYTEN
jgi:hypothetical protein